MLIVWNFIAIYQLNIIYVSWSSLHLLDELKHDAELEIHTKICAKRSNDRP